jgi:hypothetical protein
MAFSAVGFSVTVAFDVLTSFQDVDANGVWYGALGGDENLGSHAVHMSGAVVLDHVDGQCQHYQSGYAVMKNSWGTCFGDGGYVFMDLDGLSGVIHSATAILPAVIGNTPPEPRSPHPRAVRSTRRVASIRPSISRPGSTISRTAPAAAR